MSLNRRDFIKHFSSLMLFTSVGGCTIREDDASGETASAPSQHASLMSLDMVHHNPGETLIESAFNDPRHLAAWGYNGQVINDFGFFQTAATFAGFDENIFPAGSESHAWVLARGRRIDAYIERCRQAGIDCYMFTDMIVLPRRVRELYGEQVVDENGRYTLEKPQTLALHKAMLEELFRRFPGISGLVVRTGETYLHNVPWHDGNGPIKGNAGPEKAVRNHALLIGLLRDLGCEQYGKSIVYRTWAPGGIHTSPDLYLAVTEQIPPHPKLFFSIKHTKGDYHRTFDFNPTIGIGKHRQLIEIQCQREYEGKGAHPNYVMDGVINGFEELRHKPTPRCLYDLLDNRNFAGIFTWSRGGGWKGPYIENELWCSLNAYVASHWIRDTRRSEAAVFNDFCTDVLELSDDAAAKLRQLCLLSAQGVLRGRASADYPVNTWWIRDEFMGGIIPDDRNSSDATDFAGEGWGRLNETFAHILKNGLLESALAEKANATRIWEKIERLAAEISVPRAATRRYIMVSASYGRIKYAIIEQAWIIMLKGLQGDNSGNHDRPVMHKAIRRYDLLWEEFRALRANNPQCATLYKPYGFVYEGPDYHGEYGMQYSVDHYRRLLAGAQKS